MCRGRMTLWFSKESSSHVSLVRKAECIKKSLPLSRQITCYCYDHWTRQMLISVGNIKQYLKCRSMLSWRSQMCNLCLPQQRNLMVIFNFRIFNCCPVEGKNHRFRFYATKLNWLYIGIYSRALGCHEMAPFVKQLRSIHNFQRSVSFKKSKEVAYLLSMTAWQVTYGGQFRLSKFVQRLVSIEICTVKFTSSSWCELLNTWLFRRNGVCHVRYWRYSKYVGKYVKAWVIKMMWSIIENGSLRTLFSLKKEHGWGRWLF
jgi:hypothetical protein